MFEVYLVLRRMRGRHYRRISQSESFLSFIPKSEFVKGRMASKNEKQQGYGMETPAIVHIHCSTMHIVVLQS